MRDAYNYMTVQTDIAMPKRQIQVVQDTLCQDAWTAAISHTVAAIRGQDMDCRVLDLGAGAGKPACTAQTAASPWFPLVIATVPKINDIVVVLAAGLTDVCLSAC